MGDLGASELVESGRIGILNSDFGAENEDIAEEWFMAGVKGKFADAGLDVGIAEPALDADGAGDGIWTVDG